MASNETVAKIVRELRYDALAVADDQHDEDVWTNLEMMDIYHSLADRVEAAHKREMDELRECLKEAVGNECNYCRTVRKDGTYGKCEHLRADGKCDHLRGVQCMVHRWRKALEGVDDGK